MFCWYLMINDYHNKESVWALVITFKYKSHFIEVQWFG